MRILLAFLAALGIIVSSLALRVHYSTDVEPCDINAHWDCGIVNHSRFALVNLGPVHGLPVAAVGIAGYVVLLGLALFGLRKLLLVSAALGFCYALYLTNIERHVLEVWCLYCVGSQVIIALILLLSLAWVVQGRQRERLIPRNPSTSY
ncbi:vitamin K epoxide reductase family protein [Acidipila sp. EB88]|uniref:vitamin K epoxide reductase family protein n=1 Tax=Acidipila sp. EB88 TaxID=2305226 RepID=UPI0013153757|nr:vitamin K epoxide reductase family protein [Acidipila sp. EB88]